MDDSNNNFTDLVRRVRAGEMDAATDLVRQFEPTVRRAIRLRMLSPTMRRQADSMDICQSVLGSFFVRAALGQYELAQPEDLIKLLVRLARNKVAGMARKQFAQKRGGQFHQEHGSAIERVQAKQETPSQAVAAADLIDNFRARMTAEERELAELRAQGVEWTDIAAARGEGAEALRKRLQRAVERVAQEMGLDDGDGENA